VALHTNVALVAAQDTKLSQSARLFVLGGYAHFGQGYVGLQSF
jgi:hypothetical protein